MSPAEHVLQEQVLSANARAEQLQAQLDHAEAKLHDMTPQMGAASFADLPASVCGCCRLCVFVPFDTMALVRSVAVMTCATTCGV